MNWKREKDESKPQRENKMPQSKLISHDVQQQISDLRNFISAPILALVDADVRVARRFVRFIEQYGFEKSDSDQYENHLGRLKTITFRYKRPIRHPRGDNNEEWTVVHIPLLSLIPLPLLQIMEAELEYGFHVISILRESDEGQGQSTDVTPVEPVGEIYRLQCMMAPFNRADTKGASFAQHLKVKVKIEHADIPAGVATLLNLMGDGTYSYQQLAIILPEQIKVLTGETEQVIIFVAEQRITDLTVESDNPDIFAVKSEEKVSVTDGKTQIEVTGVSEGLASLIISGGGLVARATVVVGPPL